MTQFRSSLSALLFLSASSVYAQAAIEIDLPANSIGYSSQTGLLYATIASAAGLPYGNSLIEISPADGTITRSVFVGSEPGPLAISPDAPVAYAGLNGAAAVCPVDLATMTAGTSFTLGPSTFLGLPYPGQIAVMPGSPNTVAVSRIAPGYSPDYQGVAIFDSGVMRPTVDNTFSGADAIAFGSDPSTLYGYDQEDSAYTLYTFSITSAGISVENSADSIITGFNVNIIAEGSTIFATSGAAVNGSSYELLGTYEQSGGPVVLDDASNTVMFADNNFNGNIVSVFDRTLFLPLYSLSITAAQGSPISAAGCGPRCMAIVYDSNQIFIARDIGDEIFANGFE